MVAESFPNKLFLTVIGAISIALAFSAGHTFLTLRNLKIEYLENRGSVLAISVDRQVRGPDRHTDLALWDDALKLALRNQNEAVSFLAIIDSSDQVLTQAGMEVVSADTEALYSNVPEGVYVFEHSVPSGRGGPRWDANDSLNLSKLLVGLYTEPADFLTRQAYIHLSIAGLAIVTLWILSLYFVRTFSRFLKLKVREESDRHLARLGSMSATLAHEIRNPLGAVKGLTQVVQEELPEHHSTQAMMATVVNEAERLEQLVTDLLTFARPKQLRPDHFDLAHLVKEVVDLLKPEASEEHITFRVSGSTNNCSLYSDPDALRQVLLNVFKNAIDASPESSEILIRIGCAEGPRRAIINVHDKGSGLGNTNPEEFFQPFKTTKVKGSGLGLAISRQIVERLGGHIALTNREGGGASCKLEFPLDSSEGSK